MNHASRSIRISAPTHAAAATAALTTRLVNTELSTLAGRPSTTQLQRVTTTHGLMLTWTLHDITIIDTASGAIITLPRAVATVTIPHIARRARP